MEKSYKKRISDKLLKEALEAKGAVLIVGPKWCGKTTTAKQIAKSVLYMQDPAKREQYLSLAKIEPKELFKGPKPRLIDEWQMAPSLWDAIRFEIDKTSKFNQFILTGSAVPPSSDMIVHSGIGRIARMQMFTMSLFESGDSNGSVSLKLLFNNKQTITGKNDLDLYKIAFLVCRGGWPGAIGLKEKIALKQAIDYYDVLVSYDISKVDGIKRDPERVKRLLRSYARHISSQANFSQIKTDMLNNDSSTLDDDTISSYIEALEKIFVINEIPAWNPNLRSKTAIRSSYTRQFVDPSIATASLGAGPKDLINDLKTFGLMFESLVIRDLRVYAQALDGNVYHYRDGNGLECDAIIHLRNGKWAAFEIKLGTDGIEQGTKNLLSLSNKIDNTKMKKPSFLAIISGTAPYAYRREDGVYIIPIGCLKD